MASHTSVALWLQLQQFSELRLHFKSGRALTKSHFPTTTRWA
jgi:hypothetical protein